MPPKFIQTIAVSTGVIRLKIFITWSGDLIHTPALLRSSMKKCSRSFVQKKEIVFPKGTEGDHETDGKTYLKFTCTDGYLHVLEVQMEGKKKMMIEEFLRGFRSNNDQ
jgi:methionyl-tRNA formyltransferase